MAENPFRVLPSLDELMRWSAQNHAEIAGEWAKKLIFDVLRDARAEITAGARPTRSEIFLRAERAIRGALAPALLPAINATGVLLHTNLGRAPVSKSTALVMAEAAASYVALEIDRETGKRGGRMSELGRLLRLLTGAEAALIVNNNAAALLLTLAALAPGRSVIVSRGEAVEIGGGFRLPEVVKQSGARLVEVGTTNRTYPRDYAEAIDGDTAAILKVHTSNFSIRGFVRATAVNELQPIARKAGIAVIEDLGSGAIISPSVVGLEGESTIGEQLAAGADIVTASGDKLLGGPQAGIIAGRADLVQAIARHPLARAVRADKTALAGLAETLRHYVRGEAFAAIPIWRMLTASSDELRYRALAIQRALPFNNDRISVVETVSEVGGGALPGKHLPSVALSIAARGSVDGFMRSLRMGRPVVFGRIEAGTVLIDLRSVLPESDEQLTGALRSTMCAELP